MLIKVTLNIVAEAGRSISCIRNRESEASADSGLVPEDHH